MSEQAHTQPFCGPGGPWYPARDWFYSPDVGPPLLPPPFLDPRWMNARTWPAFATGTPLFVPHAAAAAAGSMPRRQGSNQERWKWRVSLDVVHFAPAEISLRVRDGFLEVTGKHEERRDEHGFIARCFTRKYRLPIETDVTKITSALSVDGVLTVEAPVPETCVPAAIIIPIQVEATGEERKDESPEPQRSCTEPEAPGAAPEAEGPGEGAPLACATAQPQQHEEGTAAAAEPRPLVPAQGSDTESLQDSSKQDEAPGSQESSESKEPEPREPGGDGEVQVTPGSAEEIPQPEEPGPGPGPGPGTSPSEQVQSQEPEEAGETTEEQ